MANSTWKRYLIGLAGGVAGTAAMDLYQRAIKRNGSTPSEPPKMHDISVVGRKHEPDESATAALGRLAYRSIKGADPDPKTKTRLSYLVHWGYGIDMGGTYAVLRGRKRHLDWAGGLAFGAALWALGDELAVPLLGLAEGPKAYPKRLHAETLGAHLVYGATTAAVSQLLER